MKIFDIHVHIFPRNLAQRAANNIGAFYDGIYMHGDGTLERAVEMMDAAGITAFAAHAVALTPHSIDHVNHFILSAKETMGDRMIPFAAMHPFTDDVQGAVDKIVAQGFRGIKIHPDMQKFVVDDPAVAPMMEAIAGRLPLLIHCGDNRYDFDGPQRIINLHANFPKLQIICAHFGGWGEWDRALELLPGQEGLLFDTSSSLYKWPAEKATEAVRRFGVENMLYGTDYPMWEPAGELERFMRMGLTDSEREDILWNNAARVFGLE